MTSFLTLVLFLFNQVAFANPMAGIEIVPAREMPGFFQIDIPADLATLDGIYEAPPHPDPRFIVHVQNAHADYGAQQKIKQLLHYLEKSYAFKTIFVEGASEDLNPDYLKMFPDKERNLKLAEFLAQQGELTGAELYLLESAEDDGPNTDQSKRSGDWGRPNYHFGEEVKSLDGGRRAEGATKQEGGGRMTAGEKPVLTSSAIHHPPSAPVVKAHGIENAELYRENYEALKKVFGSETTVKKYLDGFEGRLSSLASKVFPKDLLKLLGEWKKFEKGHREFMPYIRNLSGEAKRVLGIDLESLFAQIEWPQITRLLVLQTMEKELDTAKGLAERDMLIQFLKEKKVSGTLVTGIENFKDQRVSMRSNSSGQAGPVEPRDLMEQLVTEAGPKGFRFSDYPHFSLYAGYLILKSELDPKGLFDEIKVLFARILDKLAQAGAPRFPSPLSSPPRGGRGEGEGSKFKSDSPSSVPLQKSLLELYRNEEMVRKLLNLELTRKDWQEVREREDLLSMDAMVSSLKRIGTAVSREFNLPLSNFETKPVNPEFRQAVTEVQEAAYRFYEAARKREDVFYEKIDTVMRRESLTKAVLITGGFHTDGITELLREHEVSYGILTPRLSEKSDENLYRSVMLQNQPSTFELSYLEASSRCNSQEALKAQTGPKGFLNVLRSELRGVEAVAGIPLGEYLAALNDSPAFKARGIQVIKKESRRFQVRSEAHLKPVALSTSQPAAEEGLRAEMRSFAEDAGLSSQLELPDPAGFPAALAGYVGEANKAFRAGEFTEAERRYRLAAHTQMSGVSNKEKRKAKKALEAIIRKTGMPRTTSTATQAGRLNSLHALLVQRLKEIRQKAKRTDKNLVAVVIGIGGDGAPTVVDLAQALVKEFAGFEIQVYGIDHNKSVVQLAREHLPAMRKGLTIEYKEGDFDLKKAEIPPADLIVEANVLIHYSAESAASGQKLAMAGLKPRGIFVHAAGDEDTEEYQTKGIGFKIYAQNGDLVEEGLFERARPRSEMRDEEEEALILRAQRLKTVTDNENSVFKHLRRAKEDLREKQWDQCYREILCMLEVIAGNIREEPNFMSVRELVEIYLEAGFGDQEERDVLKNIYDEMLLEGSRPLVARENIKGYVRQLEVLFEEKQTWAASREGFEPTVQFEAKVEKDDAEAIKDLFQNSTLIDDVFKNIFQRPDIQWRDIEELSVVYFNNTGGFKNVYRVRTQLRFSMFSYDFLVKISKKDVEKSDTGHPYDLDYAKKQMEVSEEARKVDMSLRLTMGGVYEYVQPDGLKRVVYTEGIFTETPSEPSREIKGRITVAAYIRLWKALKRQVYVADPKYPNVAIQKTRNDIYKATIIDLDNIDFGETFSPITVAFPFFEFGFSNSDVVLGAKDALGDVEAEKFINDVSLMLNLMRSSYGKDLKELFEIAKGEPPYNLPEKHNNGEGAPFLVSVNGRSISIMPGTSLLEFLQDCFARSDDTAVIYNGKKIWSNDAETREIMLGSIILTEGDDVKLKDIYQEERDYSRGRTSDASRSEMREQDRFSGYSGTRRMAELQADLDDAEVPIDLEELFQEYIDRNAGRKEAVDVADVGCRWGVFLNEIDRMFNKRGSDKRLRLIGVDLFIPEANETNINREIGYIRDDFGKKWNGTAEAYFRKMLRERKFEEVLGDMEDKNVLPGPMDIVVSFYAMQYSKDPLKVVENLFNKLASGGSAILQLRVPAGKPEIAKFYKALAQSFSENGIDMKIYEQLIWHGDHSLFFILKRKGNEEINIKYSSRQPETIRMWDDVKRKTTEIQAVAYTGVEVKITEDGTEKTFTAGVTAPRSEIRQAWFPPSSMRRNVRRTVLSFQRFKTWTAIGVLAVGVWLLAWGYFFVNKIVGLPSEYGYEISGFGKPDARPFKTHNVVDEDTMGIFHNAFSSTPLQAGQCVLVLVFNIRNMGPDGKMGPVGAAHLFPFPEGREITEDELAQQLKSVHQYFTTNGFRPETSTIIILQNSPRSRVMGFNETIVDFLKSNFKAEVKVHVHPSNPHGIVAEVERIGEGWVLREREDVIGGQILGIIELSKKGVKEVILPEVSPKTAVAPEVISPKKAVTPREKPLIQKKPSRRPAKIIPSKKSPEKSIPQENIRQKIPPSKKAVKRSESRIEDTRLTTAPGRLNYSVKAILEILQESFPEVPLAGERFVVAEFGLGYARGVGPVTFNELAAVMSGRADVIGVDLNIPAYEIDEPDAVTSLFNLSGRLFSLQHGEGFFTKEEISDSEVERIMELFKRYKKEAEALGVSEFTDEAEGNKFTIDPLRQYKEGGRAYFEADLFNSGQLKEIVKKIAQKAHLVRISNVLIPHYSRKHIARALDSLSPMVHKNGVVLVGYSDPSIRFPGEDYIVYRKRGTGFVFESYMFSVRADHFSFGVGTADIKSPAADPGMESMLIGLMKESEQWESWRQFHASGRQPYRKKYAENRTHGIDYELADKKYEDDFRKHNQEVAAFLAEKLSEGGVKAKSYGGMVAVDLAAARRAGQAGDDAARVIMQAIKKCYLDAGVPLTSGEGEVRAIPPGKFLDEKGIQNVAAQIRVINAHLKEMDMGLVVALAPDGRSEIRSNPATPYFLEITGLVVPPVVTAEGLKITHRDSETGNEMILTIPKGAHLTPEFAKKNEIPLSALKEAQTPVEMGLSELRTNEAVERVRLGRDPGDLKRAEAGGVLAMTMVAILAGKILSGEMTAEQFASTLVSIAKISEKQVVPWIASVRQIMENLPLKTKPAKIGKEIYLEVEVINFGDEISTADLGVLAKENLVKGIVIMADGKDPVAWAEAKAKAEAMNAMAEILLKDLGGAPGRFKVAAVDRSNVKAAQGALDDLVMKLANRQGGYTLMGDAQNDLNIFSPVLVDRRVMIDRARGKNPKEWIAASIGAAQVSELLMNVARGASGEEISNAVAKMLDQKGKSGIFTFNETIFYQMMTVALQVQKAIQSAA